MSSDEIETEAALIERRKLARKIMPHVFELIKPKVRTEIWKSAFCVGVVVFSIVFGISRLDMMNLNAKMDKIDAAIQASSIIQTQNVNVPQQRTDQDLKREILFKQGHIE